ncbi:MAG TPA: gliding motility protein GldN [Chitinophagales bacterium]|nr:gliding motility protein GldN [Chitinophagales bacterium]
MFKTGKIVAAAVLLFAGPVIAQEPLDGAWTKTTTKEKEVIPYDYVREADVFWAKRIWRIIDVREKMNLPFKYPQEPLIQIIHQAAKNGEITVYDPAVVDADQFKQVMSVDDVKKLGTRTDTVMQINPVTLEEEQVIQKTELTWDKIVKYRVKEDWFFNQETSTMNCRIIGIAPIMEDYDASGNYRGDMTMYWVYYPDLRPILGKHEVFNPKNDAVRLSWDDLFEMRMFESYIYKESNVYDRNIQEYAQGMDALLESDKIHTEIFNFEHDLWNY